MAAGDDARQGYSQSQNLVEQDLKSPSAFDQSHAVTARFQYAIPRLRSRWLERAAGGWRISGVFLAKTGLCGYRKPEIPFRGLGVADIAGGSGRSKTPLIGCGGREEHLSSRTPAH
jgi:hypothetical protein